MRSVGEVIFYLGVAVGAVGWIAWMTGLVRMSIAGFRGRNARRPMWVNYSALTFGLAVPVAVIGLVLSGRLDWWFLLIFAPFVATRFVLFKLGRSISRRDQIVR